jgi:isocitrate dehydrogenase kinase/phosphatase
MNMTEVPFALTSVDKKPSRKYRKGSKYDPILDAFLKSKSTLVKVEDTGKDANYLRTQLKKRIDARDINNKVDVSVVNNTIYLEKA